MNILSLINSTAKSVEKTLKKFSKPAVACSFGLDSMFALYFCRKVIPNIPVIFVDSRCEYPDTYRFLKKIVPLWNLNLIKIPGKHTFQWIVKRHGFPIYSRGNPYKYSRKYLPAHYCCLYLKKRPLQQFIRREKYDVIVDGMRADESLLRRWTIKKYGLLHFHKGNNSYRFHPIAFWTREQEERASHILKIPVNPLYEKKINGAVTRSGCWCCTMNWERGKRNQFLLKYYPKLWRILMVNYGFARFLLTQKLKVIPSDENIKNYLDTRPCGFDKL
ncbi:MAG: phosphoadenosine phosphosulfate reductase family protein [Elusimicrobiota bacterium]